MERSIKPAITRRIRRRFQMIVDMKLILLNDENEVLNRMYMISNLYKFKSKHGYEHQT
jgi:hypothetical protein